MIFNQFSEFGNYLVHYQCTGAALGDVFEHLAAVDPGLRLRAFVSASGSAGTLGAGDRLKDAYGARIVAVEALECPTMLYNGFGEHNIQGIGDKHIPLIHNVYNTDIVTAVSDRATDHLAVLFSSPAGLAYLADRRHVPPETLAALSSFGLSSICNIVAAVKTAKYLGLGPERRRGDGRHRRGGDVRERAGQDHGPGLPRRLRCRCRRARRSGAGCWRRAPTIFSRPPSGTVSGYSTSATSPGWSSRASRSRTSSPGARPSFWSALREKLPVWDEMIKEFNSRSGVGVP